jgi:hypothetical protein
VLTDQTSLLQAQNVDLIQSQALKVSQCDLAVHSQRRTLEATLGQAPLQGHLTALESDLVEAARTRLLTLVAAARRLPQAGPNAATHTATRMLRTRCRFDGVQIHCCTLTRYATLSIMPRTAGVSSRTEELFKRRNPKPITVARCDARHPIGLRTNVIFSVFFSDICESLQEFS